MGFFGKGEGKRSFHPKQQQRRDLEPFCEEAKDRSQTGRALARAAGLNMESFTGADSWEIGQIVICIVLAHKLWHRGCVINKSAGWPSRLKTQIRTTIPAACVLHTEGPGL